MKSSFARTFPLSLAVLVSALVLVPAARPDVWDKRTEVKFSEPVEFPGGLVVPAGDYVMKLADSHVNRNIVQVLNEDQNHVYATVLTIPTQRARPADKTIITFHEAAGTDPVLIHKWFYPGDTTGREFPHSKDRLLHMASAAYSAPPVAPRFDENPAPANSPLEQKESALEQSESTFEQKEETLEATNRGTPSETEIGQAYPPPSTTTQAAPQSAAPSEQPPPPPADQNLPATASRAPYLAFAGGLFLAIGLLLTVTRRVSLTKRIGPPAGH